MGRIYTNSTSERRGQRAARRLVMGISGPELTREEEDFLRRTPPGGVILFSRNIVDIPTLRHLVRAIGGSATPAPTLWIDQEGGRVQRLRAPFTRYPSPLRFAWHERDHGREAQQLAFTAGRLCGMELRTVGIGVNCAPVLDLWEPGADPVIGERAFGIDPQQVVRLAGRWLDGFAAGGGLAMGKHFPGHGAATADSHHALPVVHRPLEGLLQRELAPFHALLPRLPALMTAHLVASAVDGENPATCSRRWLAEWLRRRWGYEGLIVSDALEMKALTGTLEQRAMAATVAGCDLLLCCTGQVADAAPSLAGIARGLELLDEGERQQAEQRIETALAPRRFGPGDPQGLLDNPDYRRMRQAVEGLAEEKFSMDPTEWNVA